MKEWTLPEINLERCDRCGMCVEHCPTNAVTMGSEGPFITRPEKCTYCTDCEVVCPQDAIRCGFEIVWRSLEHEES